MGKEQTTLPFWDINAIASPKITFENPPKRRVRIYLDLGFKVFKLEQAAELDPEKFTMMSTSVGDYIVEMPLKELHNTIEVIMEELFTAKLLKGDNHD